MADWNQPSLPEMSVAGRLKRPLVWGLPGLLGVFAFALGYTGFETALAGRDTAFRAWDLAYFTLQLFVFEFAFDKGGLPWTLEVARFLAPLVTGYTAAAALMGVFGRQVSRLRLRLRRRHVVVCGLGRKGHQLAQDFRAARQHIVIIERVDDHVGVRAWRDAGMTVLPGDARDPEVLRLAGVERASVLLAVTGDDGVNVDIALAAHRLLEASRRRKPVSCHVHIVDPQLCDLFKRHHVFTDRRDRLHVHVYNAYQNAARLLFREHPLEGENPTATPDAIHHLVLLGFGQMGESVALQAARVGHFTSGEKLRMTVIDPHIALLQRSFLARYPAFTGICDTTLLEGTIDDPDVLEHLGALARDGRRNVNVAVCVDDPSASLSTALEIVERFPAVDWPVMVRMAHEEGLASLFSSGSSSDWSRRIGAFGTVARSSARALLLDKLQLDDLAQAVHAHHVERQVASGRSPADDPSLAPWPELDESFRDSSRQQADHIPVKLRAVGCEPVAGGGARPFTFTEEEVETLARVEHSRWNAERLLSGWTLGDRADKPLKISPYLVDWDDLADDIREYDREAVREIPRVLERAGWSIRRG